MNFSKRDELMQCLPPAADILALVPVTEENGANSTVVYSAAGDRLPLDAAAEYVLSCLAARADKDLRLIRHNAGRRLARRRSIPLPIVPGCVLMPVMVRPVDGRRGTLGYINISRAHVIAPAPGRGADIMLLSGAVVRSLWQAPTVQKLRKEANSVHWKLLVIERRQLSAAEAHACVGDMDAAI